jgi:PAP2 superfamily
MPKDAWTTRAPFEDHEAAAVWRLFTFNWHLLASCIGVLVAGLLATEFYIRPSGYLIAFAMAGFYWQFGLLNVKSIARRNPRLSYCLVAIAQMIIAMSVMTSLTYVAISINLPLWDGTLLAWDRALGLDFRYYLDFVNGHPQIISVLAAGYRSITWQILGIMFVLPLAGNYRRTGEAICAFALALFATTFISAMVPAIGVYGELGLTASDFPYFEPQGYYDTLRDATLVRAGSLHGLDLLKLVGVLTFPSFHAVSAILYTWAFWPMRWLRLFFVPCNNVMLVATPLGGGHYFVDVIAGVVIATMAILAALGISRFVAPRWASPTEA